MTGVNMNFKGVLSFIAAIFIVSSPAMAKKIELKAALMGEIKTVEGKQTVFVQTQADGKFVIQAGIVLIVEEATVIENRLASDGALVLKIGVAELTYANVFGTPVYRIKLNGESTELKPAVFPDIGG